MLHGEALAIDHTCKGVIPSIYIHNDRISVTAINAVVEYSCMVMVKLDAKSLYLLVRYGKGLYLLQPNSYANASRYKHMV